MKKLTRDFFDSGSVVMIGYSSKKDSFCRPVYQDLMKAGIKVFPVNKKKDATYDVEVYNSLSDIETMPEIGYILTSKAYVRDAVKELSQAGIKKVLVQSKSFIDEKTVAFSEENGVELYYGCPLMAKGKGLHRFHGWLAGVK